MHFIPVARRINWELGLKYRGIVRVSGTDASHFLNGLTTNQCTPDTTEPFYTCFLTPQGKLAFEGFLIPFLSHDHTSERPFDGSQAFFLDCDARIIDSILGHLNRFKLRSQVTIENVSDCYGMWAVGGPESQEHLGSRNSKRLGSDENIMFRDPRHIELGLRVLGRLSSKPKFMAWLDPLDFTDYLQLRYNLGIAEGSLELVPTKQMPLECNMQHMNAISFNKGCYLGQELVARVHHTGVIRKSIMPIEFEADENHDTGTVVLAKDETKVVGHVLGASHRLGIAMLRHRHVDAKEELMVRETKTLLQVPFT